VREIFKPSYKESYYFDRKDRIHIDKLIEKMKDYYSRSFSHDIIYFMGYLDLRRVYVYDFFEWCVYEYPNETISILEEGINTDDKLIKEVIKRIIRGISSYDFKLNAEIDERRNKLKGI
jgi:hypothetical protein